MYCIHLRFMPCNGNTIMHPENARTHLPEYTVSINLFVVCIAHSVSNPYNIGWNYKVVSK
jgi:hypothetical protein